MQSITNRRQIERLLREAIWLPQELYKQRPILFPHVARSNGCRKDKEYLTVGAKRSDAWGCPNPYGFFQDDNSLVKNLVRFRGEAVPLTDSSMAPLGLVACHILPPRLNLALDVGATFDAELMVALRNSFVPNLVWLPRGFAPETDLRTLGSGTDRRWCEPTIVHEHLLAVAWELYGASSPTAWTARTWRSLKNDAPGWSAHRDWAREVASSVRHFAWGKLLRSRVTEHRDGMRTYLALMGDHAHGRLDRSRYEDVIARYRRGGSQARGRGVRREDKALVAIFQQKFPSRDHARLLVGALRGYEHGGR